MIGGLGELNAQPLRQCLAARERTCGDNTSSVATRFEHDHAAALAAPARAFDPCVIEPGQADKYQTVPFDRNRYSVPRRWAFRTVSVKGYVGRVEVVGDVAARCYRTGPEVPDPLRFPGTLGEEAGRVGPRAGVPRLATVRRVARGAGRSVGVVHR